MSSTILLQKKGGAAGATFFLKTTVNHSAKVLWNHHVTNRALAIKRRLGVFPVETIITRQTLAWGFVIKIDAPLRHLNRN
jgi:hypothetical protein